VIDYDLLPIHRNRRAPADRRRLLVTVERANAQSPPATISSGVMRMFDRQLVNPVRAASRNPGEWASAGVGPVDDCSVIATTPAFQL
jgi:hypothetical protein